MKKITIFTDPHLGTSRAAHTTKQSSARLKETLYWQAMSIVNRSEYPCINAGDLFDKALNAESVIVQGFNVASKCLTTLGGNHDSVNREGVITSLQAIKEMGAPVCLQPDMSVPFYESIPGTGIYLVPHHASQILFEQAMRDAAAAAGREREGQASYLFLHCSFQFDLAKDDNTLNLTAEMLAEIGDAFDYIFIGHEHNGYVAESGKVVVLGNTHPTSFHDVGDKYVYTLELETAELTKEKVWSKDNSYREIKLGSPLPDLTGVQFVDVVGNGSIADVVEVNAYIQEIWKASFYRPEGEDNMESSLFAVRNKVELRDALADQDLSITPEAPISLQERIKRDLKSSDLLDLFTELTAEATV